MLRFASSKGKGGTLMTRTRRTPDSPAHTPLIRGDTRCLAFSLTCGTVKVQVSLRLYFGVMTMWLVELISVAKVYLRLLVLSARDGYVRPPPISKRTKAWPFDASKV